MSEATATLDPETQTATQAQPAADTQDDAAKLAPVTDGDQTVQTDPGGEEEADRDEEGEKLRTAERASWELAERERIREEEHTRIEEERRTQTQRQSVEQLRQHFPNALAAARNELRQAGLDDATIQLALRHVEGYNLRSLETAQALIYGPIEDGVQAILPKDAYAKFTEKASGKQPAEFLREFLEHGALETKAVKSLSLEDAIKRSPKLKAEIDRLAADKYEAGRSKGRKDPPGDPKTGSSVGRVSLSLAEIDAIPTSEWMSKPKEERERLLTDARKRAA